jgi:hypothetical protein
MEIARDLSVVPARPGSKSSGLYSEIPAVSAGAGTWVCGNRKDKSDGTRAWVWMQVDSERTQDVENRGTVIPSRPAFGSEESLRSPKLR